MNPARITFVVLALCPPALAQLHFAERDGTQLQIKFQGQLTEINDIAAADFDGDGDLDLLFASNVGSGYAGHRVCFQDEHGRFAATGTIPTFESARRVAVGDVDGDGDLDVLFGGGRTAYGGDSETRLVLNDGSGQFSDSPTIPVPDHIAAAVVLADVDGDLDLDAVVFEHTWSSGVRLLHIWHNDGAGTFTDVTDASITVPLDSTHNGFVVDIDGDGDHDILTGSYGFANDGSGTFVEQPTWSAAGFTTVDLDGDGDLDFVGTTTHLNDGAGNLTAGGGYFPVDRVVTADFDGDGDIDVAGVTDWPVQTRVWLREGLAYQEVTTDWLPPHANEHYELDYSFGAIAAADLDGDGDGDLVTGGVEGRSTSSTTVGVPPQLLISTRTAFVDGARPAYPHVQKMQAGVAHGDIDGDGDTDLIAGAIWRQGPDGRFHNDSNGLAAVGTPGTLRDFDGDGDLDHLHVVTWIIGLGPVLGPASYGTNDGTGNFTYTQLLPTAGEGFAVGDVDGDGDLDCVIDELMQPIALFVNQGNGTFVKASTQMPTTTVDCTTIALGDIDDDGDLDMIASEGWYSGPHNSPPSHDLLLYRNDGSGTFSDDSASLPTISSNTRLLLHDADGDLDLDILVDGHDLTNDGTGHFVAAPGASGRFPDLDGDGALETVTYQHGLTINGQSISWGWNVDGIAWPIDVDDDGDLDLVAGNLGSYNTAWALAYQGILYNLQRDLRCTALPRLGRSCRFTLQGGYPGAATIAWLFVSLNRLPQPVAVGDWGRLYLDPLTLAPLATLTLPNPDTPGSAMLAIPLDPTLLGLDLSAQALFVPIGDPAGIHLSAVVTEPLIR